MIQALYKIATTLAAPAVAGIFVLRPKLRPLLQRFHPTVPRFSTSPIWLHACSVGEVNTARPLINAIHKLTPDIPILLTVSTATGKQLAHSLDLPASIAWFPIDQHTIVRRFINLLQPRTLLLLETELWPNVINETHRRHIPIFLINGRLSDRHMNHYKSLTPILGPLLNRLTAAAMQDQANTERIIQLGMPPENTHTTGNLKFDSAPSDISPVDRQRLRDQLHIPNDAPVILFGSTRPGDEALAADCWKVLRTQHPHLRLIIAPRHLHRLSQAAAAFPEEDVILRSTIAELRVDSPQRVIILDTHGELARLYAVAAIAVIGGSLHPGVEGHNPIEPAALGIPTVFGPHMRNFRDPAQALVANHAAIQIDSPEQELCPTLRKLIEDPNALKELSDNARKTVAQNKGATERTLHLVRKVLSAS